MSQSLIQLNCVTKQFNPSLNRFIDHSFSPSFSTSTACPFLAQSGFSLFGSYSRDKIVVIQNMFCKCFKTKPKTIRLTRKSTKTTKYAKLSRKTKMRKIDKTDKID